MSKIDGRVVNFIDEHSSIIKLTLNSDGEILSASAFAERLAGRPLVSTHIRDLFTGFNAGFDYERLLQQEQTKVLLNVNTFRNMPESFYFSSLNTDGRVVLLGESDGAEAEEMRASMIKINNELSNLTRELNKKNAQLDQLNKLKNQFIGMAAHDLRNPIASIIMFTELVLESETGEYNVSDNLRKIVTVIKTSSEYMLRLLEELLDMVKIESGKLQLNYERVQPVEFLKQSIIINSMLAEKKDIRLILEIPQPLPEADLDPVKIEQVLNNLISNAIKYSNRNSTITVSAFSSDRQLIISVKDEGCGIPESAFPHLFTPFSGIGAEGTEGEKSTGLGLSIVKSIVSGHMGRIWVESEVGKGSTFHFSIPVNK